MKPNVRAMDLVYIKNKYIIVRGCSFYFVKQFDEVIDLFLGNHVLTDNNYNNSVTELWLVKCLGSV
jgi:hypothetical protein